MHLLLAGARWPSDPAIQPPGLDELPHLRRALARLRPGARVHHGAERLSPPQEWLRAADIGIDAADGALPWAALAARERLDPNAQRAWAWVSATHWVIGQASVSLDDPDLLALAESESDALLQAMQPYFLQDGIRLHPHAPGSWLAESPLFETLRLPSLERVAGQGLQGWMPESALVRRLLNEMQMLFYAHPVNEARSARALPVVGGIWIHGCGRLAQAAAGPPPVEPPALRRAIRRADAAAWRQAWREIDAEPVRALLQALDAGTAPVRLSLVDEAGAQTYGPGRRGPLARWLASWRPAGLAQGWATP